MKNLLVLLILSLPLTGSALDFFYCKGDTLHVLALNGLKLRQIPNGEVLATIRLGETVVVDSVPNNLPGTFENIDGYWLRIRYKSQTGYVFAGYLTTLPPPSLNDSSLMHYVKRCFTQVGKTAFKTNGDCPDHFVGEEYFSAQIRFFQSGNHTVKTIDLTGWEGGYDTYEFDYVSLEEVWLIVKVIYRKELEGKAFNFPETISFDQETRLDASLVTDEYSYWDLSLRFHGYYDPKVSVVISWGY